MRTSKILLSILVMSALIIQSCNQSSDSSDSQKLSIDYEKYTLPNGLDVILHEDTSDPIVSVAILVHAGSNREKPGRTGFAHFFEHMLFQRSENVPQGAFFKNINDYGGTFNGGTSQDFTVYYEVVPKDALEKVLWMESDRMGFFINSVTLASLEGEKPVVKNEKRQRVDNRPYGHTNYVINKALYPSGHPYNWEVIGELEDLSNATLDDVKEFYDLYYGPNNATLVIAGDFNKTKIKDWVDKYFGEIPSRGVDKPLDPMPVTLDETKSFYHEDNFASLPSIRMTWPTVEQFHPDQWALDALGQVLYDGKRTPLYKEVVEKQKLVPNIFSYNSSSELAGTFTISARANNGTDLDSVKNAIEIAFANFERDGVDPKDLDRIKAGLETGFYNGISSILGKSFQLAIYNEFAGSPDFISTDIANIRKVTPEDVMNAYNKYIKGKNYILTSFVPKGQQELAITGGEKATVKEEEIVPNQESTIVEKEGDNVYEKTPSNFDRSVEPGFGEAPLLNPPTIWTSSLANGMKVYGVESNELPLVNFSIRIDGGHLLDAPEKSGVANLITDIMMEGTATKTPEELEDAIGQLGANVNMFTSASSITISANCLKRNYEATLALVQEILLEPRWDQSEFDRIKTAMLNRIRQRNVNPNSIANMVMSKYLYGADNILSIPTSGTLETVENITLDDLKAYYEKNFSPSVANFHVAGNISKDDAKNSVAGMADKWTAKDVTIPELSFPESPNEPVVLFVDIPDAKQSVIQISRLTVPSNSDNYFPITVANEKLGGGASGKLFQVLREEKGYTYGAYSFASRGNQMSSWTASSSVKSNVTKEALDTFKEVIGNYAAEYTEEDLEATRTTLIKENTRNYETLGSLLGLLQTISGNDLPLDFIDQRQDQLRNMTVEDVKGLVNEYVDLNKMYYVIVGDKATQFDRLKVGGAGDPIEVDKMGKPLNGAL
ncbi:MAG: pitrilysin family protein [Bacteroidota bacterium]